MCLDEGQRVGNDLARAIVVVENVEGVAAGGVFFELDGDAKFAGSGGEAVDVAIPRGGIMAGFGEENGRDVVGEFWNGAVDYGIKADDGTDGVIGEANAEVRAGTGEKPERKFVGIDVQGDGIRADEMNGVGNVGADLGIFEAVFARSMIERHAGQAGGGGEASVGLHEGPVFGVAKRSGRRIAEHEQDRWPRVGRVRLRVNIRVEVRLIKQVRPHCHRGHPWDFVNEIGWLLGASGRQNQQRKN